MGELADGGQQIDEGGHIRCVEVAATRAAPAGGVAGGGAAAGGGIKKRPCPLAAHPPRPVGRRLCVQRHATSTAKLSGIVTSPGWLNGTGESFGSSPYTSLNVSPLSRIHPSDVTIPASTDATIPCLVVRFQKSSIPGRQVGGRRHAERPADQEVHVHPLEQDAEDDRHAPDGHGRQPADPHLGRVGQVEPPEPGQDVVNDRPADVNGLRRAADEAIEIAPASGRRCVR